MAKAIGPNCKIKYTGIRPGEKLHEEMISEDDSINTFENSKYYIICTPMNLKQKSVIIKNFKAAKVKNRFSYKSNTNKKFLNVKQLENLIKNHLV